MKKILLLILAACALIVPSTASAETYDSNVLSGGAHVCPVNYGLAWYGQWFGLTQVNCGQLPGLTVATYCYASNSNVPASQSANNNCSATAVGNSPSAASSRFILTLPGSWTWSAPGCPSGQSCFYSGNQDANTSYTCTVNTTHRQKDCSFLDKDA